MFEDLADEIYPVVDTAWMCRSDRIASQVSRVAGNPIDSRELIGKARQGGVNGSFEPRCGIR